MANQAEQAAKEEERLARALNAKPKQPIIAPKKLDTVRLFLDTYARNSFLHGRE